MMGAPEEPKYTTATAKAFYRLRDLFVQKGSVFTAKSINLASVGITAALVILFMGLVLYRISTPIGNKSQGWEKSLMPTVSENLKIAREPKAEEKAVLPSNEELLQRLTGIAAPPQQGRGAQPRDRVAQPEYIDTRLPTAAGAPACVEAPIGSQSAERKRADEPVDSTMAFEVPPKEDKGSQEKTDYEYVNLMAPVGRLSNGHEIQPRGALPSAGTGAIALQPAAAKPSLFQEVRARLLTRIDTSLPESMAIAEIARDYKINGFSLKRGDLLLGKVAAASPRRVSLHFDRLIDRDKREHEIQAEALDLTGATGLAAKPADSRLKKGLLLANDRALDYVRAFRGRVSIYNNPLQGDLRQIENRALIVEPNTEFYVIFSQIQSLERSS